MPRASVLVVTLVMLATFAGLLYFHTTRPPITGAAGPAVHVSQPKQTTARTNIAFTPVETPAPPPPAATDSDSITQWVADTQSPDANTRAAAIASLAHAPKSQAMPALERVLKTGEPQTDRPIALQSLHTLALHDGDRDGRIRGVIRDVIYHGDDDATNQTAQALLEDIEAEFAQRAQASN